MSENQNQNQTQVGESETGFSSGLLYDPPLEFVFMISCVDNDTIV